MADILTIKDKHSGESYTGEKFDHNGGLYGKPYTLSHLADLLASEDKISIGTRRAWLEIGDTVKLCYEYQVNGSLGTWYTGKRELDPARFEVSDGYRERVELFIRELANLSDKPDNYEWYDSDNDPVNVDLSNCGDWHSHGSQQAEHLIAVKARAIASALDIQLTDL